MPYPLPHPQISILEESARSGSPVTLEFDASDFKGKSGFELSRQFYGHLTTTGYEIEHTDEDTLEGKPIYHFHVRRQQQDA